MSVSSVLVYGANGYTGRLIIEEAVRRGLRPTIGGRNAEVIEAMGREHGLDTAVFDLSDATAIDTALAGIGIVLHCAGPFVHTAAPMVEGCLRNGAHYLDITGEVEVIASVAQRNGVARERGVLLMPAVGFDVVPSDCLAVRVAGRCPGADRLRLAFRGLGQVSRGTATTMAENLGRGGAVLQDGRLRLVPAAWKTLDVDFGRGPTPCVSIPWGDLFTAHVSTGIPNIEVYMAAPASLRRFLKASRLLAPLLRTGPVRTLLRRAARRGPAGPGEGQRERGSTHLWACARSADGRHAISRMHGPEGYTVTVLCALDIVGRITRGDHPVGFHTPAGAYGSRLAVDAAGYTVEDLEP